jgi:hypothetical protein
LPPNPFDRIFCGHFCGPAFCFQYFAGRGGRGVGQPAVASSQLSVRKGELCRPYGTRFSFQPYPALKRWAKLFRPYGAGFPASRFHWQVPTFVLTPTLPRWAKLLRAYGAGFPASKSLRQMPTFVLAQTLKRWAKIPRAHGIRFGEVRSACRVGSRAATQSPEGTRSYLPLYQVSASLFENCAVPEGDGVATCAAALRLNEILRLTRRSRAGLTSSRRFAAGVPQLCTTSRAVMSVATQSRRLGVLLSCRADLAKSEPRRAKSLIGPRVATLYLQPGAFLTWQADPAKSDLRRATSMEAAAHAC